MTWAFKTLGAELSNWGRWGDDDERGTLNFLTPAVVLDAVSCIRSGRSFELSIPLGADGAQDRTGNRVNPVHLMSRLPGDSTRPDGLTIADDYVMMPTQAGTQWDGLGHIGYDDLLYNGVSTTAITAIDGATRLAIDASLPGFVGRGVLLDVARHVGDDWLAADHPITPADLDDVASAQGVQIRSGDAVLVRTGMRRRAVVEGWSGWLEAEPGLTLECATWLHDHEIAAVASDNWGIELYPTPEAALPLHCVLIRDLGMMLGEIWDLDELASQCASDGQWDFFLSAPVLRIVGGVGSPTSPIAVM